MGASTRLPFCRFTGGGSDVLTSDYPERLPYGGTWNGIVGVRDVDPTTRTKHNVSTANGGDDATGTMPTTATLTQVNNAIAAAPANTYVELASGVFSFSGNLTIDTDRKTLRGQVDANGNPTTTIRFGAATNRLVLRKGLWDPGTTSGWTRTTVSSDSTTKSRGSTQVTLASTTGLSAEQLLWFSVDASGTDIDGDNDWTCFHGIVTRAMCFVVKVTSLPGSNVVNFTPAINPDYISSLTLNASWRSLSDQINYSGCENLIFEVGTTGYFSSKTSEPHAANQCWFHNCDFRRLSNGTSLNAFVYWFCCYGCELKHCKFSGTDSPGDSSQYAICSIDSSGMLTTNCEMTDTSNAYPVLMTSGSAFVYNYLHDMNYGTFMSQWVFAHGGHNHYNLFEGNWINGQCSIDAPTNTGNETHTQTDTYVRNRIVGKDTDSTTNLNCLIYDGAHKRITAAANVFGTTGPIPPDYEGVGGPNTGEGEGYVYNMTASVRTNELARLGNYNTINSGIPAAETTALNGKTVATSYVYTSKPSWFGDRPWPWCTPSNFSQSNTVANCPAAYRAINSALPPGATF